MSNDEESSRADDIARLQASLAELAAHLTEVSAQVKVLADADAQADVPRAAPAGPTSADGAPDGAAPLTTDAAPLVEAGAAVRSDVDPSADQPWAIPAGAWAPPSAPGSFAPPIPSGPLASPSAPGSFAPPAPAPSVSPAAPVQPAVTASLRERTGSWADTAGLKALGWVGGGITLLGIALLVVVAIQRDLLSAEARVGIGFALGVVLLAGGSWLQRSGRQAPTAATLMFTGIGTEYLTTLGAMEFTELLSPFGALLVAYAVTVVAILLAFWCRRQWLAAAALVTNVVLAPSIFAADSIAGVFAAEAVLLASAAVCLLRGLGAIAWRATGIAVAVVTVMAMGAGVIGVGSLAVIMVMTLGVWALFLARWMLSLAPADPGQFAIRPRSYDPAQIARDYADFDAHQAKARLATSDRLTASTSLSLSVAVLMLTFATTARPEFVDPLVGGLAVAFAVLFGLLAWAAPRVPQLAQPSLRLIAWASAVVGVAVAELRLIGGDLRPVSWIVLAAAVLFVIGVERFRAALVVALVGAGVAFLAVLPLLNPVELFWWPTKLLTATGLWSGAWTAVFPAGIGVLMLCAAVVWAVSRCLSVEAVRGSAPTRSADDLERERVTAMGWTLVSVSAVACYGLLAVTMVLAYAISPTSAGFQGGQIAVTALFTLVALGLLWQGFRRVVLRLGGLGIAAVAVSKLLLFDTRTLDALPRALTVIGVGAMLLLAAVAYVMTLSRIRQHDEEEADTLPAAPQAAPPAPPAAPPA